MRYTSVFRAVSGKYSNISTKSEHQQNHVARPYSLKSL